MLTICVHIGQWSAVRQGGGSDQVPGTLALSHCMRTSQTLTTLFKHSFYGRKISLLKSSFNFSYLMITNSHMSITFVNKLKSITTIKA